MWKISILFWDTSGICVYSTVNKSHTPSLPQNNLYIYSLYLHLAFIYKHNIAYRNIWNFYMMPFCLDEIEAGFWWKIMVHDYHICTIFLLMDCSIILSEIRNIITTLANYEISSTFTFLLPLFEHLFNY